MRNDNGDTVSFGVLSKTTPFRGRVNVRDSAYKIVMYAQCTKVLATRTDGRITRAL